MRCLSVLLITFSIAQSCTTSVPDEQNPAMAFISDSAMVVSAHPDASEVGVRILRAGGNAVDAAIAVQFALAVVHPAAGNIGGGGFMLIRETDGTTSSLDFREAAPLASTREMYLDEQGNVIEGLSLRGHLASGVPGTVDGMVNAYQKYGSLPWKDLVQPAVDLAENGVRLTEKEARGLNAIAESLEEYNSRPPEHLLKTWRPGDQFMQKDLAETLKRIRDLGRLGFYDGVTADLIVAEMERGGGLIKREDLAGYRSVWREPVYTTYRGHRVISMAPPSSGGIALIQLLNMAEPFPLSEWERNDPNTVHLMTEAERRVYADRAKHLGDPDFFIVPQADLIDSAYLALRMQDFRMDQATASDAILAGEFIAESEQTTHFSIVDEQGNAVAVTTTLNGGYGSRVVVHGAGFFLNNEMDDFSIKAGVPNMFGLLGGEANAIAPAKRMLSSMTPTIVEKEGKLFMVVGTPGGSTIITSVFQTITNVIDFNMGMQEAVNFPRHHHQWKPDTLYTESNGLPAETIKHLESRGHYVRERSSIGRVDAILVLPDGQLEGGADPRGDDAARGY